MTDTTKAANRSPLVLTDLEVKRAPGISPGFALNDLSPDITIVFGPNASGKSTTARAIQSVLWPHTSSLRGHHLAASFTLDGQKWQIDASSADVRRYRDGDAADPPQIAPIDDRARYALALPELLASENRPLAQAILNESSGGFDLPQVAESLGFGGAIPARLDSANRVKRATSTLEDISLAESRVDKELGTRSALLSRLKEALAAERDMTAIDTALDYRRRLADEAETTREIAAFPETVHSLTGEEPARIAQLGGEIARQTARIAETLRQRDHWQHNMQETGLADATDPATSLKDLRVAQDQLAEIDQHLTSSERELSALVAERTSHQRRLAADMNDEQIAAVDADGMREFAELAASYESIRSRRTARDEVEMWLGGVKAPENLEDLRTGVDTLQQRLQHPNAVEHRQMTGMALWIGIGGGLLLAGAGVVLGVEVHQLWWIAAALGVIIAFLAWRSTQSNSPRIAAELESSYAALPLPQPESWQMHSVRDLLGNMRDELKVALVEQEKADRWSDLEQERQELDDAYATTETRREAAIARYGVAPDLKEESLRLLAENLGRWQATDANVRGIESRRGRLATDRDTLVTSGDATLARLGLTEGDTPTRLHELDRRLATLRSATAERDALQDQVDHALQPRLDATTAERDGIFQQFSLAPNDLDAMQLLQQRRTQLLQAQERLVQRQGEVRERREALSLTPTWREMDVSDLNAARTAAALIAQQRPDLERELAGLDQLQNAAMRATMRESAQAQLVGAREDLIADRDKVAANAVGDLLLGTVQRETRDAALPIVFHRARELFAIITRGKYELQFEQGPPPEFTSLDTATGMSLSLDQLSSGTRVQLLMAIRLAFVENVEVGPKLPVILDETLGNSDELRASAIIDAAIDICKHGRQVFYFTAQGEEVARWLHRVESMPTEERPDIKIVQLADVRPNAGFARLPIPENVAPLLSSPLEGASNELPALDIWADGVGSASLAYVVTDTRLMQALADENVTTIGQLQSIARSNPRQLASIAADLPDEMGRIGGRSELLRQAVILWRIGRAQPMPASVLGDADMIDEAALADVQALLASTGNNGEQLIAALDAMDDPPMSGANRHAFEQWMVSEHYLPEGEPLSDGQVRERLQSDSASEDDIDRILSLLGSR